MGCRGEELLELIRCQCPASWPACQEPPHSSAALRTYPGTTLGSASSPDPFLRDQAWLPAGGQASTSGSGTGPREKRWGPSCGPVRHACGAGGTRLGSVSGKIGRCWRSRARDPAALCDQLSSSCTNPRRCASLGDIIRLTKEPCYCSLLRGHSSFD